MTPSIIQLIHTLENHKHSVCFSIDKVHIHEKNLDCSLLHRQLQTLAVDFPANYNVIPQQFYASIDNNFSQIVIIEFTSRKNPRGPPFLIV